jgi:hypothetical protein
MFSSSDVCCKHSQTPSLSLLFRPVTCLQSRCIAFPTSRMRGAQIQALHGRMKQAAREGVLEAFTKLTAGAWFALQVCVACRCLPVAVKHISALSARQQRPLCTNTSHCHPACLSCYAGVLLATDLAARGLDIPEVNWVVQVRSAFR